MSNEVLGVVLSLLGGVVGLDEGVCVDKDCPD